MSHRSDLSEDPRRTVLALLSRTPVGMLSIDGSALHPQPMTQDTDPDRGELWFLTSRETEIVRAIGQGARAHFTVTSDDHCLQASFAGAIVQSTDPGHLDRLWSGADARGRPADWFPGGRDDPDLLALRMTLSEAMAWAASTSTLRTGIERLRATLDPDHAPDLGVQVAIPFNG
ncbi:pyridoxamine 5'-phosphate oxidase family protein [Frigidibacter sp. MR17.24]|uniref:pyridoxamine 5'-phosphate oxidase family protein n=1 Tax=Frigidibacter sp. MR17.24 TaxID=3127345 RepID=UPI003012AF27